MKKASLAAVAAVLLFAGAPAFAATEWLCLAQDHEYSYESEAASKRAAQSEALRLCRAQSRAPANCYSHRCEAVRYAEPPRWGGGISVPGPRPAPGDNDPVVNPGGLCNGGICHCSSGSVAPGGTYCP